MLLIDMANDALSYADLSPEDWNRLKDICADFEIVVGVQAGKGLDTAFAFSLFLFTLRLVTSLSLDFVRE